MPVIDPTTIQDPAPGEEILSDWGDTLNNNWRAHLEDHALVEEKFVAVANQLAALESGSTGATIDQLHRLGIFPEDINPLAGTGDPAIDQACFDAMRNAYPGLPWLLAENTTYHADVELRADGQQLIGMNEDTSIIEGGVAFAGNRKQQIKNLTIRGGVDRGGDYGAVGIWFGNADLDVRGVRHRIEQVHITGVGSGIVSDASIGSDSMVFSVTIDTVRISQFTVDGLAIDRSANGQTGSRINNLYINNNEVVGGVNAPGSCRHMINWKGAVGNDWGQVNCEHARPTAVPIQFTQSLGQNFGNFYVENVNAVSGFIIGAYTASQTALSFGTLHFFRPVMGNGDALIGVGNRTAVDVGLLQVWEGDYEGSTYCFTGWGNIDADTVDTVCSARTFKTKAVPAGQLEPQESNLPLRCLRAFSDRWTTYVDGADIYRTQIDSGVLTTTLLP